MTHNLVNVIIETELELFKQHYSESPILPSQDLRSLAIAWLCFHFSEHISDKNVAAIKDFVWEKICAEDYNYFGWSRLFALKAANAILIGDDVNLLAHVSCEQLADRHFALKAVSIIAPSLDFENEVLREAVEYNIAHNQGYADESILLLLRTKGSEEDKKEWIKAQLSLKETNSTKLLGKLLTKNACVENGFYLKIFSEIKDYLLFRILGNHYTQGIQTSLWGEAQTELTSFQDNNLLNTSEFRFF